jgi:alanyl-tRNA synthetase
VETICQEKVKANLEVFTMVAPLEKARAISSLRAVFGETYPDPVRVVSIGQAVPPMLEDPESASWSDLSVEFCGGTHMGKLGEASDFLIVNETAVSKGERRIEAVTGRVAAECRVRATALQAKIAAAGKLSDEELDNEVKTLGPEIDQCNISQVTKNDCRKELDGLVQRVKKYKKAIMKKREKSAVGDCEKVAAEAKAKGEEFTVVKLEVGTNAKLGRQMMTAMSKAHPEGSFMVFSIDADKGAVMCIGKVSAGRQEKGLEANKWVSAALAPLNGKGGGKKDYANGQAKGLDGLDKAIEVGKAFPTQ